MTTEIPTQEKILSVGYRYLAQGSENTGWALFYQNPFTGLVLIGSFRSFEEAQKRATEDSRNHLD